LLSGAAAGSSSTHCFHATNGNPSMRFSGTVGDGARGDAFEVMMADGGRQKAGCGAVSGGGKVVGRREGVMVQMESCIWSHGGESGCVDWQWPNLFITHVM